MPKIVSHLDPAIPGGFKMATVPGTPMPVGFCPTECLSPTTIYLHLPPSGDTGPLIVTDDVLGTICDIPAGSVIRADLVNSPACEWAYVAPQPQGCLELAQDMVSCFGQVWAFQFHSRDLSGQVRWQAVYAKPVVTPPAVPTPLGTYLRNSTFSLPQFTVLAPPQVEVNLVP